MPLKSILWVDWYKYTQRHATSLKRENNGRKREKTKYNGYDSIYRDTIAGYIHGSIQHETHSTQHNHHTAIQPHSHTQRYSHARALFTRDKNRLTT